MSELFLLYYISWANTACINTNFERIAITLNRVEDRCIPRQRAGLREYMDAIGVIEYDPFEIIMKTAGRMAEDNQWIEIRDGKYDYCPVFDNGAGLLSNTQISQMDIDPKALIAALIARPFNTTFTRQMNSARSLYGRQFVIPSFGKGFPSLSTNTINPPA